MELWLSIVGFLVVIGIIVSIMTKKLYTMVALSVIPLIGAILVGQFTSIPAYLAAGISKVAVNGVMFVFAILFFGTMMTAGAFDPIVKFIIKCCRGNPLYVCIGTYVLSIVGHLDGSATTTVLLVCGAMIPIYQKMHMRLRNLAAILAMAAGLMNISPWGGPTLRAATVMEADLTEFFQPMLVPILITIAVGLIPVVLLGLSETKRLKAEGFDYAGVSTEHHAEELSEEERSLLRPKLTVINLILIVLVVGLMISGILTPGAAFLTGTALAASDVYKRQQAGRPAEDHPPPRRQRGLRGQRPVRRRRADGRAHRVRHGRRHGQYPGQPDPRLHDQVCPYPGGRLRHALVPGL